MMNAAQLAKYIVEEVTYELGPCILPGGFKPPHKGHFEAVKDLASRGYIDKVHVVISQKERDGITAKQSLETWQTYLKCEPIPKAVVEISSYPSPVTYAYKFIEARPNQKPIYLAGAGSEVEDQNYFKSLQKRFGDQVLTISVEDKFERISASTVREALRTGNYEKFKECVPEAVNNKGETQKLFKSLASTIKEGFESEENKERDYIDHFLNYCCEVLAIEEKPSINYITDSNFPQESFSFGNYTPGEFKIGVYINNRNLADILRTLAHELVHHKQDQLGQLTPDAGETGSEIENDANASAAMLMRDYGRKNPNIYSVFFSENKATLNEGLIDHAQIELTKAGLFDDDADYGGMIGVAVLELLQTMSKQGHSGFSAQWTRDLFNRLSNWENLTPLTSDPDEWEDRSEMSGHPFWQNKRNPSVFSNDGGQHWWHVDGKTLTEGIEIGLLAYKKLLVEEKIPGGLSSGKSMQQIASHHKTTVEKLDKELLKGIKVEMEHTTSKEVAREIAMDHLWEDPNYYTNLKKVEKK